MKWSSFSLGLLCLCACACANDTSPNGSGGGSGGGTAAGIGSAQNHSGSSGQQTAGAGSSGPCSDASDCVLVAKGCCAACLPTKSDFEAVLASDQKAATIANCHGGPVGCGACQNAPYDPLHPVVRAACMAGRCTVVDLREQPQSACMKDAECHLAGVGCCGSCGGDPSGWISLSSAPQDPFAPACDPVPPCAPCALNAQPAVFCADDGHCAVGQRP